MHVMCLPTDAWHTDRPDRAGSSTSWCISKIFSYISCILLQSKWEIYNNFFFEYARELRIVVLLREKEFYNRAEHEAHAKRHLPGTRERKSLEKNNVIWKIMHGSHLALVLAKIKVHTYFILFYSALHSCSTSDLAAWHMRLAWDRPACRLMRACAF